MSIFEKLTANHAGILSKNPDFIKERGIVKKYYEFYDGFRDERKPGTPTKMGAIEGEESYGQEWHVPDNLDYVPTQEIRNIAKKLIDKQARFFLGVRPALMCKPIKESKDKTNLEQSKKLSAEAEDKRTLLDKVMDDADFWSMSFTAFKDCTIGRRVLLLVMAGPESDTIRFQYFTMPEFTYNFDPNDSSILTRVCIVYQDERTIGRDAKNHVWHKWIYEMREDGRCWATHEIVDGYDKPITGPVPVQTVDEYGNEQLETIDPIPDNQREWNTLLTRLPCHIIFNGGLTGDIWGTSDVKDLIDIQTSYNRTISDYRDALRFKMFEQPVFIDADSETVSKVKIAPNAMIDIKSDVGSFDQEGGRSAKVQMLSSSFNFATAVDGYLDRLKKDMYELMDQPTPEQVKLAPSAKAIRFLFFDLMARCEEKWAQSWDRALMWVLDIICECIQTFNLYRDFEGPRLAAINVVSSWTHNYPIPEDEEVSKGLSLREVEANVKSRKTYIREHGKVEDENMEWSEIIDEMGAMNEQRDSGFMHPNEDKPKEESEEEDDTEEGDE